MGFIRTCTVYRPYTFLVIGWCVKLNAILAAIHQCASNHGCSHTCGKIGGVDTCSCPAGYELDGTNKKCVGKYLIYS